jgi:hypothetical protein
MPDKTQNSPEPFRGEYTLSESPELATQLKMRFSGANQNTRMVGIEELPGKSNYFIGTDPGKWRVDVPHYAKVREECLYPGVDVIYYGSNRKLEYDLIISPGVDAKIIRLDFDGAQDVYLDGAGDLVLNTHTGDVILRKPVAYQEVDGAKKEVRSGYIIGEANGVGFELETMIDPAPRH